MANMGLTRKVDEKEFENLIHNASIYAKHERVSRKTILLVLLYAASIFDRNIDLLLSLDVNTGMGSNVSVRTGLVSIIIPIMCFQYFNYSPFTLYWKMTEEELVAELKSSWGLDYILKTPWDGIKKLIPFSLQEIEQWTKTN